VIDGEHIDATCVLVGGRLGQHCREMWLVDVCRWFSDGASALVRNRSTAVVCTFEEQVESAV
jgi:hypothetical protein